MFKFRKLKLYIAESNNVNANQIFLLVAQSVLSTIKLTNNDTSKLTLNGQKLNHLDQFKYNILLLIYEKQILLKIIIKNPSNTEV